MSTDSPLAITPTALQQVRGTLEHVTANFRLSVQQKPVRDMAETLAEVDAALTILSSLEHLFSEKMLVSLKSNTDFLKNQKTEPQREVDGWQPIETAPRDGQDFLGARKIKGKWEYEVVRWWRDRVVGDLGTPTHWMPLPAAPKTHTIARKE